MLKVERLNIIMNQINLHNKVLSSDLCHLLNVSEDTVRRDLNTLAKEEKIIKVHGGAIIKDFNSPFQTIEGSAYEQQKKKSLSEKALSLLKNDMVVITEGGSTILEFAKVIPNKLRATFFTLSPLVALALARHTNLKVITIGGNLNKDASLVTGGSVINSLIKIKADLCFSGCNGLSVKQGLTDFNWEVVQVKMAMMQAAKATAILTISEKLGSNQNMTICPPNQIDYLVTELPPKHPDLLEYKKIGITVI